MQQSLFAEPESRNTMVMSPCGRYRYWLRRDLTNELIPEEYDDDKPESMTVAFIMLNPSVATLEVEDPTSRKVQGFARRWGATDVVLVNLFALRSTDPAALLSAQDPVGPDNDVHLRRAMTADRVVVAWGANTCASRAARTKLLPQVRHVEALLREAGVTAQALGYTADDQPIHPLMLPYDQRLVAHHGRSHMARPAPTVG